MTPAFNVPSTSNYPRLLANVTAITRMIGLGEVFGHDFRTLGTIQKLMQSSQSVSTGTAAMLNGSTQGRKARTKLTAT